MTWVKLCGMTRRGDVEAAAEAGADAVGFVVHAASPRAVSTKEVRGLAVDAGVLTFLVSVDEEPDRVVGLAIDLGMSGVQPHGRHRDDTAVAALEHDLWVLAPVRIGTHVPDVSGIPPGARPLLDTAVAGAHGGTGVSFDWALARSVAGEFVLAGGLLPSTVGDAVRAAGAWGVDVASGVESEPGIKDHAAMRRFVEEARR